MIDCTDIGAYLHPYPTQMAEKPPSAPETMQRLTASDLKWLAMRRYRKKNAIVGLSILAGVLGVYAYSMWAVKQEDFLDEDFNTPGPSSSPSSRTSHSDSDRWLVNFMEESLFHPSMETQLGYIQTALNSYPWRWFWLIALITWGSLIPRLHFHTCWKNATDRNKHKKQFPDLGHPNITGSRWRFEQAWLRPKYEGSCT